MSGTRFLRHAYNCGMELILLVFLLSQNGDGDFRRTLRSFLEFYRENRELLSMLAGTLRGDFSAPPLQAPDKKPEPPREPRPQEEKNRPPEGIGDVLESYLKRAAL